MALTLDNKKLIVAELTQWVESSIFVIVVDYRGLTAKAMVELRAAMRSSGVKVRVARNTLMRRAIDGTQFSCLKEALTGLVVLFFSTEEPSAAARILRSFIKLYPVLEVRAMALSGTLLSADQLEFVASLPSREEALSSLCCVMQAPVLQLMRTLNELIIRLLRTLLAIRAQKDE